MNILLIEEQAELRKALVPLLEVRLGAQVVQTGVVEEAGDLLKSKPVDFVLSSFTLEDSPALLSLVEGNSGLQFILAAKGAASQIKPKGTSNISFISREKLLEELDVVLAQLRSLGKITDEPLDRRYCQISTLQLVRLSPLRSDIYIRLSKEKYIRLMAEGDHFEAEDLRKYHTEKKIPYLYLRREDMQEFLRKYLDDLGSLLKRKDDEVEVRAQAILSYEILQELIDKLGFNENVQTIAKQYVQLCLSIIGKAPTLQQALTGARLDSERYLSSHTLSLAEFSCVLASAFGWSSGGTFAKLVQAALFHDLTLRNPKLASVSSLSELEAAGSAFTAEEKALYKAHPTEAVELLKKMSEVHSDVDSILLQHHELPDGTGFPAKLSHTVISPLASIFIVCHDLVQHLGEKKGAIDRHDVIAFVLENRGKFQFGNFKKALSKLEELAKPQAKASSAAIGK